MKAMRSAAAALALTVLLMVAGHVEAGDEPQAAAPTMATE